MLKYFRLWRIILSILVLIYTVVPFDFLPDMAIGWGWLDDIVLIYLLWHFFFKGGKTRTGVAGGPSSKKGRENDESIAGNSGQTVPKTPHDILDVPRDASWEEIKSAYKKLAGQYHPDKVLHLGEEFKALAEKRFKEIQDAYDELKSRFG